MGTLYSGDRSFYVDENEVVWDSIRKLRRYNADGSDFIEVVIEEAVTTSVTMEPSQTTETIVEVLAEFKCEICGQVAKSKAGLFAHKRSH